MKQYLVLIHRNAAGQPNPGEWERFFAAARESGMFRGGSEIGHRTLLGRVEEATNSLPLAGYMRFDADDEGLLRQLLAQHPVVLHGGTIELCELPRS